MVASCSVVHISDFRLLNVTLSLIKGTLKNKTFIGVSTKYLYSTLLDK